MVDIRRLQKYVNAVNNNMYQCENCGRKELIRAKGAKTICSHCGNYIFKTKKDEFIYRMKGEMINEKIRNQ